MTSSAQDGRARVWDTLASFLEEVETCLHLVSLFSLFSLFSPFSPPCFSLFIDFFVSVPFAPVVQSELCDAAVLAEGTRSARQHPTQEGGADAEGHGLSG